MKAVTQRLRDIEVNYAMPGIDHISIRQARHLLIDLWMLCKDENKDFRKEAMELFIAAGMEDDHEI